MPWVAGTRAPGYNAVVAAPGRLVQAYTKGTGNPENMGNMLRISYLYTGR